MRSFRTIVMKTLCFLLETSMAVLVLDVLLGVVSRYVMGQQVQWTEELARLLLVWSSFFGIALAFDTRAHLGIDLVVNLMDSVPKKTAGIIAHAVTLLFTVVVFLYGGGFLLYKAAFLTRSVMPALQVPDAVMYLPIPVAGIFILYFEICNLMSDLRSSAEKEA